MLVLSHYYTTNKQSVQRKLAKHQEWMTSLESTKNYLAVAKPAPDECARVLDFEMLSEPLIPLLMARPREFPDELVAELPAELLIEILAALLIESRVVAFVLAALPH